MPIGFIFIKKKERKKETLTEEGWQDLSSCWDGERKKREMREERREEREERGKLMASTQGLLVGEFWTICVISVPRIIGLRKRNYHITYSVR